MTRGRAQLAIGQGISVWVLEAPDGFGDACFHAHHAIQFTASLSGKLRLLTGELSEDGPIVAVAADALHRFEAQGLLGFIFVEPESQPGRAIAAELFAETNLASVESPAFAECVERLRLAFDGPLSTSDLLEIGKAAVAMLAPAAGPAPDPRVQRIIDYAVAHVGEPLSLEAAAEGVYLSPSRLRHLFVEQTGLAFKTYVLWLRLVRAVELYAEGKSLTEAAHSAGFSDSAHFSRIFKRTFGLPATTLTRL